MSTIDASSGLELAESVSPKTFSRRRSFTEKIGHTAFEDALAKSKEREDSWEAGYHAEGQPRSAEAEPLPTKRPEHQEVRTATEASNETSDERIGTQGKTEKATTSDSTRPDDAPHDEAAAEGSTVDASDGATVAETNATGETDVVGELALAETAATEDDTSDVDPSAPEELASTEGMEAEGERGSELKEEFSDEGTGQSTLKLDSETEVEFEIGETELATPLDATNARAASSTAAAPASAPPTFVESFGRQAFARSTQLHKTVSAAPAQLDMNDLVEQIAKVRGSMTGGRARIVVGEGSERLALTVMLRNGTVDIDARVADVGMAQSLERGSAELSEALSKHGLSLGTMDTGSSGGESGESDDHPGPDSSVAAEENPQKLSTTSHRLRRGVRIVA
ncbi:MAG: hypothetical protein GY811_24035 [Myxococcales bacterium]|nr:hypothetical protein [Myxococcales bacterium]